MPLARRGQIREGDEHLAATARLSKPKASIPARCANAWRAARAHGAVAPRVQLRIRQRPRGAAERPGRRRRARRASIAVMPFVDRSPVHGARGGAGRRSRS